MILDETLKRKEDKKNNLIDYYIENDLMERLFFQKKNNEKKTCENERIIHPLFIKADKCFVVYRNPLSPYITEKVPFIFLFFWQYIKNRIEI